MIIKKFDLPTVALFSDQIGLKVREAALERVKSGWVSGCPASHYFRVSDRPGSDFKSLALDNFKFQIAWIQVGWAFGCPASDHF